MLTRWSPSSATRPSRGWLPPLGFSLPSRSCLPAPLPASFSPGCQTWRRAPVGCQFCLGAAHLGKAAKSLNLAFQALPGRVACGQALAGSRAPGVGVGQGLPLACSRCAPTLADPGSGPCSVCTPWGPWGSRLPNTHTHTRACSHCGHGFPGCSPISLVPLLSPLPHRDEAFTPDVPWSLGPELCTPRC